jgi:hypothetical protein
MSNAVWLTLALTCDPPVVAEDEEIWKTAKA